MGEGGGVMKKKHLVNRLGKAVLVPPDWEPWRLVEIYSNGNVGCVPMLCSDYKQELREFHWESIRHVKESE
jgi:hypothetical protein